MLLHCFWPFWADFGYVSHIPAIRFWCHCIYRTLIWCRIPVENFVRIVWTVFEKFEKSRKMAVFWPFWANSVYVSHIPAMRFWCICTRRGPFGIRMTVRKFVKIVWTVFEKFEIFMTMHIDFVMCKKRSGEKKQKKQHDCISSRKFFPTPKNAFDPKFIPKSED